MKKTRVTIIVVGILLPYLARLPRGYEWVTQYFTGLGGTLFFGAFNAIAWSNILYTSYRYKHPASVLFPAVLGFGFIGFCHFNLDLASSSTAAIALVFIPIYALAFITIGALLGYFYDKRLQRSAL